MCRFQLCAAPCIYPRGLMLTVAAILSVLIGAGQTRARADYLAVVGSHNPLAHWALGETSGTTAGDYEGGFDGKYVNGVTLGEPGAINQSSDPAARFDGRDDYIEVPHDNVFLLDDGTLMVWFKADTLSRDQGLFSKDSSDYDTGGHLTLYRTGSNVTVRLQSTKATYALGTPSISSNVWVHVACSWGSDGMQMYLNGQPVASNSYRGGLGRTSGGSGNREPIAIGANSWGSGNEIVTPLQGYFDGVIDEVLLFGYQLTDEQIQEIYNAALPQYDDLVDAYSSNKPIAWWRLDESLVKKPIVIAKPFQSVAIVARKSIAKDETGNHDGTYENGVRLGRDGAPIGGGNKAAEFDGYDDYVDVGAWDVTGSEVTFLAWFCANSFAISDARILSKTTGTSTNSHYWMLGTWPSSGDMRLRFRLKTDGITTEYVASRGDYGVDEWVFAAAVYDGSNMILYQNGTAVGSAGKSGKLEKSKSVSAWIGGNPSGATDRPFDGLIDEVAIFDKALSAQEIQAIYSAALNPTARGWRIIKWVEITAP